MILLRRQRAASKVERADGTGLEKVSDQGPESASQGTREPAGVIEREETVRRAPQPLLYYRRRATRMQPCKVPRF